MGMEPRRIGNRSLLQTVAKALRLEGLQQIPGVLDAGNARLVYNIGSGIVDRQSQSGGFVNAGMAGVNIKAYPLVCTNAVSALFIPSGGQPIDNLFGPLFETRVLAIETVLTFDAAGATAFNTKGIDMTLEFRDNITGAANRGRIASIAPVFIVATGTVTYRWTLGFGVKQLGTVQIAPITWNGIVPIEHSLFQVLSVADGTNWPANTTLSVNIVIFQNPSGNYLQS